MGRCNFKAAVEQLCLSGSQQGCRIWSLCGYLEDTGDWILTSSIWPPMFIFPADVLDILCIVEMSCLFQDDVQTILHHQLLKQQRDEQAQKKSRFGVLRRSNKPLPPKPNVPTVPTPESSPRSSSPNTSGTQRWTDKFKRGKISMQDPVVVSQQQRTNREDTFQVVSLDWWAGSLIITAGLFFAVQFYNMCPSICIIIIFKKKSDPCFWFAPLQ